MLSEHHVSPDGYLPSPIPVAAAFAAVTSTIPISVAALLVNLYDPIRLAEEIAVLDHLSAGRVNYTLGLGYRREEYDLFGVAWATRGPDIEDRIQRMLDAWADGTVTPGPFSQPHPMLFYGGGSVTAAKRAARLGLHFQPQVGGPGAQGDLRGRVPRPRPRPGLHAARARRSRQRLLRRGPRPLLGRARPLPARRRPGVRRLAGRRHDVVRPRRLVLGRGDARRRRLRRAHRRRPDRPVPGRRDQAGHQPPGLRRPARRAVLGVAPAHLRDGAAGGACGRQRRSRPSSARRSPTAASASTRTRTSTAGRRRRARRGRSRRTTRTGASRGGCPWRRTTRAGRCRRSRGCGRRASRRGRPGRSACTRPVTRRRVEAPRAARARARCGRRS